MKKTNYFLLILLSTVVGLFSAVNTYAQGGTSYEIKPVLTESPNVEESFAINEIKRFNASKTKNLVISQFNISFMDEDNIDIRSGGTKGDINDARLIYSFKIVNYDKEMLQAATDELYDYLVDKFTAAGYTFLPYEKLKADKNYAKLEIAPSLNGEKTTCAMNEAKPGYYYTMPSALGFSAKKNPTINIFGMKGMGLLKAGTNLDANILSFGMIVHFLESEGKANRFGAVEANFKPQLFFQMASLGIMIPPAYGTSVSQKQSYGYTFGKEFVASTNEGADKSVIDNAKVKAIEYTIDNEKFKAAFLELGKSYIDNMVSGLTANSK